MNTSINLGHCILRKLNEDEVFSVLFEWIMNQVNEKLDEHKQTINRAIKEGFNP